jgi:hypothetical protein
MKISFFGAAIIAIVAGLIPSTVHADTYQIFNLGNDGGVFFYGMDDSGNVVLNDSAFCVLTCYQTYIDGVPTGLSIAPPDLHYDNGTPCTPSLPPPGKVLRGVCNGAREAFTGTLTATQFFDGIYTGSDPAFTQITGALGGGLIFMNGKGDIVYDDAFAEDWFEAIDLTTVTIPEPASIFLIGTGALAIGRTMRKRSFR